MWSRDVRGDRDDNSTSIRSTCTANDMAHIVDRREAERGRHSAPMPHRQAAITVTVKTIRTMAKSASPATATAKKVDSAVIAILRPSAWI